MLYANIKLTLFSLIPGAGMANLIYLGLIVWFISIYLSNTRWNAFVITLIFTLIFKGIDMLFLGQGASQILNESIHMLAVPLILTLINNRISRLG
ncbi:MAG: hypothetical protein JXR30_02780 [Alphaproteobacteria bacterium]|nr:hypothetical protein [Alphaproteobacteria bacterium]